MAVLGDGPAAIAADLERDDAGALQLAEDRAPLVLVVLLADAEGGQPLVAEFENGLGLLAAEEIDQMLGAEALAGTGDGRKRLLRSDSAVDDFGTFKTDVAIAARLGVFAEIGEQRLPPAARRLTER